MISFVFYQACDVNIVSDVKGRIIRARILGSVQQLLE